MPFFHARDLVAFPGGDNSSDTVINNVHYNKTTLDHFNYTLYSNGTMSNGSSCILTFEPWAPTLLYPNGTFVNRTSCYSPIDPIGERAKIAMGLAVAYGVALFGVLLCLSKHGKLHLPTERRFYPIGRRWQWYWAIFTCATAMISLFVTIDVDRYYLPQLPIVLTSFFWYLMQMGAMAAAWEAVRHWGSWMERQFVDPDPFILPQDDRRSMFEFWIPLGWYFFLWMVRASPSSSTATLADTDCRTSSLLSPETGVVSNTSGIPSKLSTRPSRPPPTAASRPAPFASSSAGASLCFSSVTPSSTTAPATAASSTASSA